MWRESNQHLARASEQLNTALREGFHVIRNFIQGGDPTLQHVVGGAGMPPPPVGVIAKPPTSTTDEHDFTNGFDMSAEENSEHFINLCIAS